MNALSLFSGIGGIDIACEGTGIKTVAFCEQNTYCQQVLRNHWADVPIYDDIHTLTKERLEQDGITKIDFIHGGYPCQPFSFAGKRAGASDDRYLWTEVKRLLADVKPRWFLGENVAGHVTLGLDQTLSDLEELGYSCQTVIIPALAVNAWHRRDRVFIIAYASCNEYLISAEDRVKRERTAHYSGETVQSGLSNIRNAVSNAHSAGLSGSAYKRSISEIWTQAEQLLAGLRESRVRWSDEPDVARVADGVPNRTHRIKALGNAVVPHQIAPIIHLIKLLDGVIE